MRGRGRAFDHCGQMRKHAPPKRMHMYQRDLTPYRYDIPDPLPDVLAVGWLSRTNGFPHGDVPCEFANALERLLVSNRVNQMRGFHVCEFCKKSPIFCSTPAHIEIALGSAEIWMPSRENRVIYAAPDLIYHYVLEHRYLPPNDFIHSVLHSDHREWNADQEFHNRIDAAYKD